jgi:hypothetical protein
MLIELDHHLINAEGACSSEPPSRVRVLGLDGLTSRTTAVKCMGRTYGVTAIGGAISISDLTDITHPVLLGTARANNSGRWEIHTACGGYLTETDELLHAVAELRRSHWPGRDQPVG